MADKKNILLIGKGGREHALAWKIHKSPLVRNLYIAPGNPGTALCGMNVDLAMDDFAAIESFINKYNIDLTVVGPEQPLVDGIVDFLEAKNHVVFGPSKVAAQLEGSKSFAKNVMQKYDIPTALFETFGNDEWDKIEQYIKEQNKYPIVLKADGLAGGKGVFICQNEEEVVSRLKTMKEDSTLRSASNTIVVEEFMEGEEVSVFAVSDGAHVRILSHAQDHKRIGEGDTGLNTGGMGAYSPAPVLDEDGLKVVYDTIVRPTIEGMAKEGMPYKGVLYCGLMMTDEGPKVVEYNCRFGDPECQVLMPRLKTDLVQLMLLTVSGELEQIEIEQSVDYQCCVVLVSGGYPGSYDKGKVIKGVELVSDDTLIFHSGTGMNGEDLVTAGGRVLGIVGSGDTLAVAIEKTYDEIDKISFDKMYYRHDIGSKGLKHLKP
ncbi:MAG TPA: phosphoribosylamine--glycine ligase [Balneolales bacterium]|nr:phosphoribosylamine--glycine ligase [Balneolales bacterium]